MSVKLRPAVFAGQSAIIYIIFVINAVLAHRNRDKLGERLVIYLRHRAIVNCRCCLRICDGWGIASKAGLAVVDFAFAKGIGNGWGDGLRFDRKAIKCMTIQYIT